MTVLPTARAAMTTVSVRVRTTVVAPVPPIILTSEEHKAQGD